MKIAKAFLGEDYRADFATLFFTESGNLKPETVAQFGPDIPYSKTLTDRVSGAIVLGRAINGTFPYAVPHNYVELHEVSKWMKENVHDGWALTMKDGVVCFAFARAADAINFKMAWT